LWQSALGDSAGLWQSALGDSAGLPQSAAVRSRRLHLTPAPPEGTDRRSPEAIESPPVTAEQRSGGSTPVGTVVGVCVGVVAAGAGGAGFALARRRCGADDQAAADYGGVERELNETVENEVDPLSLANPLVTLDVSD
jgi:hypothetical protein